MKKYKSVLKEELRVLKRDEMLKSTFAQKLYKANSRGVYNFLTSGSDSYDYDKRLLTDHGIAKLRGIIAGYIWNTLDMGANIAGQSTKNLRDEDYTLIYRNLLDYANKVKWKEFR